MDNDKMKEFMGFIDATIERAQGYGEEFSKWWGEHLDVALTNEQIEFLSLYLSKESVENPMLLAAVQSMQGIVFVCFLVGYRAGWEAAKADSILGGEESD